VSAKVLICEDERIVHEFIRKTLRDGGIESESAFTGADALRLAREQQPQLILLDMILPDMDGAQVLSTLRAQDETRHTPVIVLSGTPPEELKDKLAEFSVADYVLKPFDPEHLLRAVRKVGKNFSNPVSEKPLILVVEGSHVHQKVVGRFLEDNGFQPIFAENVQQALQFVSTFLPQVIVMDLQLPKGSGLELLAELKSRNEKIPVIVTSGIIDKRILQQLSSYDVKAVLTKPIVVSRLQEELDGIFTDSSGTTSCAKITGKETQILLVEDFLLTLRATEKALGEMGFRVISARDGASALTIFSSNLIDLIVLDIALPGMNGVEFLETVRRWGSKTPCIVVSGSMDSKKQEDLQQLDVKKFFPKPLNFNEFGLYVNGLLRDVDPSLPQTCPYDVLIAMNSDHAAHLAEETVRSMGFVTQTVNDGFLALAELRRGPRLFVFDVDLGGVDGPELARRAGPPDQRRTRLLTLAEYLDDTMEGELRKIGIDAALRKPFRREELQQKLSSLLEGSTFQIPMSSFLDSFQKLLDALPPESDADYWKQVGRLGHDLRGSAMYVNRSDLASLGQQIDDGVKWGDTATVAAHLTEVKRILQTLRQEDASPVSEEPVLADQS
jgi:CheY-like chemotaxis protein